MCKKMCVHYSLLRRLASYKVCLFLNQVHAGLQLAHAWFLEIVPVQTSVCVFVCVCPPPRLLITSGVIWTPYDWLKKFYSGYMAIVVVIVNGHGLCIDMRHNH